MAARPPKAGEPDWDAIRRDYRAGVLSIREIARRHASKESSVRTRATAEGWRRDLRAAVRQEAAARIAAIDPHDDDQAIDEGASAIVAMVRGHRRILRDLAALVDRTSALLAYHLADPRTETIETRRGEIERFVGQCFVSPGDGVASLISALTAATEKLIRLERQALGADDGGHGSDHAVTIYLPDNGRDGGDPA